MAGGAVLTGPHRELDGTGDALADEESRSDLARDRGDRCVCAGAVGQSVTFSWSSVAGAASYELQVDDSTAFSAPLVLSRSVAGAQSSATLPKANLSWRVRAIDASGNPGAWSTVRSLEIK